MAVQSYRDLDVWRIAMELAKQCFVVTNKFPRDEIYGMTSQIRRASTSIPANIAEGQGRSGTKEFLYHLSVARGSLKELETHLLLSESVGLLDNSEMISLLGLCDRVSQMLSGLRRSLKHRV